MDNEIAMILRARPYDRGALLPYNELSSGLIVLEESSAEYRERYEVLRARRRRRRVLPLSVHATMDEV